MAIFRDKRCHKVLVTKIFRFKRRYQQKKVWEPLSYSFVVVVVVL